MATTKTTERTQQAAPKTAPNGNLPATQEAKAKPRIVQFREYVDARMATLEESLPPTIPPRRFVAVIMTALQNKPTLLDCTFPSLWNACVRAAQDGLLPDGREGAIAPYGENKDGKRTAEIATWMPMIEGYRKKIFEGGQVKSWDVQVVMEKDEFDYELGDTPFIKHKPYMGAGSPGGIAGAYSIAKLTNGETVREVMSAYKIMQIKSISKAQHGPWSVEAFAPEMARKVVARRHYKQLPHHESMDAMIARDDQEHGLLDPNDTPAIAQPQRRLQSRQQFDTYAGETIDHETGEVTSSGFETETAGASGPDKASAGNARKEASGPPSDASKNTASPEASGASKEADATRTDPAPVDAASASTPSATATEGAGAAKVDAADPKPAPATASTDLFPGDTPLDGEDRPWPPGTEPTNEAEYERYVKTKLQTFTRSGDVPSWWGTEAEKALRQACKVDAPKLMKLAVARRDELAKQELPAQARQ
jgi:recombination protein RecT